MLAFTVSCDGGRCVVPVTIMPTQSLELVGYEDSTLAITLPEALGGRPDSSVLLGRPPVHGLVTVAGREATYTPERGFVGRDEFSLTVRGQDWVKRPIAVTVTLRSSYELPPTVFTDLRQGSPTEEFSRPELANSGEYALVRTASFCARLGCQHEIRGNTHTIRLDARGLRWVEGNAFVHNMIGDYQQFPLPAMPMRDGNEWWFPVRFLAEELGLNTTYDPRTRSVKVFRLLPALRDIQLRATTTVLGADFGTTRLIAAHESADSYWLLYDASSEIVRVRKGDSTYTKLKADAQFGIIHSFFITSRGDLFVGTTLGALLQWRDGRFDRLTGVGADSLETPGNVAAFVDFRAEFISDMVATTDGSTLYFHDWVTNSLYEADLIGRSVRLLAAEDIVGGFQKLALVGEKPAWVGSTGVLRMIDPKSNTVSESTCFQDLLGLNPASITAAIHVPSQDLWLFLDAQSREVIEARIPFGARSDACGIVRRTFTGDETSYLFAFATSDMADEAGVLVIDNGSRLLVRYGFGGSVSIIPAKQLVAGADFKWLGPTKVVQNGDELFIVANRSHQIVQYSLASGALRTYIGSGDPSRGGPSEAAALDVDIGFPSAAKLVDGKLWVSDTYNRRIVVTDGVAAHELFPPTDPGWMSAIADFDRVEGTTYLVDHGLGLLMALRPGDPWPVPIGGVAEGDANSRSTGSIAAMRTLSSVRFGLPVSVTAFTPDTLLVADDARKGIWLVSLTDGRVEPVAGFRNIAAATTWGDTGNAGMAAGDLRLAGLGKITYDPTRKVVLVPSRVSRKIIFIREDLSKTCVADISNLTISPEQAFFLEDGRLAVVDFDASALLFFAPPDLSCLATGHPD